MMIRRDSGFIHKQSASTRKLFAFAINPNIEILARLAS